MYLSLPCVIDRRGVSRVLTPPLGAHDVAGLRHCAAILIATRDGLGAEGGRLGGELN